MDSHQSHTRLEPFSWRETAILRLVQEGLSNREISQKLFLSLDTVKWYNKQIFAKLGASNRTQAVKKAAVYGLLLDHEALPSEGNGRALSNLPAQITSFIGRVKDVSEIKQLLKKSRLVVLNGAGGSGKTRLALQIAGELQHAYRDGVWLVEFAAISEPALVADTIAQALKVNMISEASVEEVLKRFLARKHLLLVLDNLEHLPAVALLVGELLAAAPQVSVLATSRERLHVYGEQEYSVYPLSLPDLHHNETSEQILASEAVRLFIERAQAAMPGFMVDEPQLIAIARICVHLDGLPLAIELAASHVKILPPARLAERLEADLDAIPPGPRNLPARQRTLRATIDWSYQLLQEREKILFARLAVFRGGGVLSDIEAICTPRLPGKFMHLLISLVEKNLVYPRQASNSRPHPKEGHPDGDRLDMLETIHEFAAERLVESGEAEMIRTGHAEHYTRMAEEAAREIRGARQIFWFDRLRAEQDNLRAVLGWSLNREDGLHGLRIVAALRDYWYYSGKFSEGRYWTEVALEGLQQAPPALRAGVLNCAGMIAGCLDDYQTGIQFHSQAAQLYRQCGDEGNATWSLVFMAAQTMGIPAERQSAMALCNQGLLTLARLEDGAGMSHALNVLGELARLEGDVAAAKQYYQDCLEVVQETGERLRQAFLYTNLSFIAYRQQDYPQAIRLVKQAMTLLQEMGIEYPLATHLGCLAGPVAALGDPRSAATLLGASYGILETMGAGFQAGDQPDIQRVVETVRARLGEGEFQAAWQAGQGMSLEQAVSFALAIEFV